MYKERPRIEFNVLDTVFSTRQTVMPTLYKSFLTYRIKQNVIAIECEIIKDLSILFCVLFVKHSKF